MRSEEQPVCSFSLFALVMSMFAIESAIGSNSFGDSFTITYYKQVSITSDEQVPITSDTTISD